MSIKVELKLHDMRIWGRIVRVRSTEQSVRHLLTLTSFIFVKHPMTEYNEKKNQRGKYFESTFKVFEKL